MHFVDAKGILSFGNGMNIYRGCSHGCIYCDSRSKCYGFAHDFEDIEVKQNAPQLLEAKLKSKKKKCMIGTGAMCDPYLHIEENLELTRQCLLVIDKYEFGVSILTKSDRILRDIDLLKSINKKAKAVVQMTLTTYDDDLCRIIEPNVCVTSRRVKVLERMRDEGIPTIVWFVPILPFINDTEENVNGIMDYCVKAGVMGVLSYGMGVTLRDGDREFFYEALNKNFPGLSQKYHEKYGYSYEVISDNNDRLMDLFKRRCIAAKIMYNPEKIFGYLKEFPENREYEQLSLF